MSKKNKNPLTKEQLEYLDKNVRGESLRRFWSKGPDYLFPATWIGDWNLSLPRMVYDNKLLKEDENDDQR